ncbi:helix-turn-helix transcriptional regulator [Aquabacterium sp.]|uniref:helix-turn-helix transcriptional regulator n=1 Tax=Aquabacterium sp. TaxID=1872578 RepID=UPI002E366883|nr:helix-turn-helix transcriptional regulator [Aquabacterium sp.]HEX5310551.1 helix-turn-helix transcriptional regulator [Aquabacterium sp.]
MSCLQAIDDVIVQFYRSASGEQPWGVALEHLRLLLDARVVTLHGLSKTSRTVAFSFEVGDMSPQAALDFIRRYHQIEPRTPVLLMQPVGHVMSCHKHFSEEFVATDPYHQEFLIPYGLRYCTAIKAYEDSDTVVLCAVHRGTTATPMTSDDEAVMHRLGRHLEQALSMHLSMQPLTGAMSVGLDALRRLPYPILLLDETRRIVFENAKASELLKGTHPIRCHDNLLGGPDRDGDAQILLALRSLGLSGGSYPGDQPDSVAVNRSFVRLSNRQGDWIGLHCYALRASESMGAFGSKDLALVMLHAPEATLETDPFVVAAMWDLSPAEAGVFMALGQGMSADEIALERGVSLATIRTQIRGVMTKTGANRQAELVSLLACMPRRLGVGT